MLFFIILLPLMLHTSLHFCSISFPLRQTHFGISLFLLFVVLPLPHLHPADAGTHRRDA